MNIEKVRKAVRTNLSDAILLRRTIHENPELSGEEYETTKRLKTFIQVPGLEIEDFDLEKGLVALVRGKRPGETILMRADIDALPMCEKSGLPFASKTKASHTCGHDIHASVLALCARVIAKFRDELRGNIRFIFQPSEETLSGAKMMLSAGILQREPKPSRALGLHCYSGWDAGKIGVIKGLAAAASDIAEIIVLGKGGHVARPHECVDATMPACDIAMHLHAMMSQEKEPTQPGALCVTAIHSEGLGNISDKAIERISLRTYSQEQRDTLKHAIERIAKCIGKSYRADVSVNWVEGCPAEYNDPELSEEILSSAKEILGEANASLYNKPVGGSEDFAYIGEIIPLVQFRLGAGTDDPATRLGCHNQSVIFDESAIETGALALAWYVLKD